MYDGVILLHNRNGHDTVNQLHLDKKKKEIIKLKKKKKDEAPRLIFQASDWEEEAL